MAQFGDGNGKRENMEGMCGKEGYEQRNHTSRTAASNTIEEKETTPRSLVEEKGNGILNRKTDRQQKSQWKQKNKELLDSIRTTKPKK